MKTTTESSSSKSIHPAASKDLLAQVLNGPPPPRHVAIIMDGNGRWAKQQGLPRTAGHKAGVEAVKRILTAAAEVKIEALTVFAFSVENWGRPKSEISAIMRLLYDATRRELREMIENNVRLIATGDIDGLPATRRRALQDAIKKTRDNTGIILNLALNYSGRAEILHAVRQIVEKVRNEDLDVSKIDEAMFAAHLQTNGLPDPDLLIRTSGERRLSNFLLWQTSYTELYITETLWPDFDGDDFYRAILDYQARERRFGRIAPSRS